MKDAVRRFSRSLKAAVSCVPRKKWNIRRFYIDTRIRQSHSHPFPISKRKRNTLASYKCKKSVCLSAQKGFLNEQRQRKKQGITASLRNREGVMRGFEGCNFVPINFSAQTFWELNGAWWVYGTRGVVGRRGHWCVYVCVCVCSWHLQWSPNVSWDRLYYWRLKVANQEWSPKQHTPRPGPSLINTTTTANRSAWGESWWTEKHTQAERQKRNERGIESGKKQQPGETELLI